MVNGTPRDDSDDSDGRAKNVAGAEATDTESCECRKASFQPAQDDLETRPTYGAATPDRKTASYAGSYKAVAAFLLLWSVGPTLFRAAVMTQFAPRFPSPWMALSGGAQVLLLSFPQDLFVALQVLLVAVVFKTLLVRAGLPPWRAILSGSLTAAFAIVHIYLLFDCLLYCKTGIRMSPAFLDFLPAAECFSGSAWELGLGLLGAGLAAIMVSLAGVFYLWQRIVPGLRFSLWLAPLLLTSGLLAAASRNAVPPEAGYAADNRILGDESELLAAIFSGSPRLGAADKTAALELLRPQAEHFRPLSPDYPLMKHTDGFFGPKQFEIDVAPGERPHVVFIFLESFRAADVGVLGGRHNASPQFDRLAREGVLFRNFYANGIQTTRAVIASLFGIHPPLTEKSPQESNLHVPLVGVADVLNRRGYTSAYFTGSPLRFERQDAFFANHGYAEVFGDTDIARALPEAKRTSWGYHDEYVMRFAADWLLAKDRAKQPAFVTLFTITHHHPWELPDNYVAPAFDSGDNAEYGHFLRTFHYSDHCLGQFIERLRATGLDRRTIVFILGDHGCAQGEHENTLTLVNALYEENVHIPLLILAPGRLKKPVAIDDIGSQVDLLPTVMDLLGLTGVNHAVGTSLVRRVADRTAYFNNPFALQFLGLRRGEMKYLFTIRSKRSSLFDLSADPQERNNLAAETPAAVEPLHRAVDALNRFMLDLYLGERFVEAEAPR